MQVTTRVLARVPCAAVSRTPTVRRSIAKTHLHARLPRSNSRTSLAKFSPFSSQSRVNVEGRLAGAAKEFHNKGDEAQESKFEASVAQEKEKQTRTPWHREGSSTPPVARPRQASAMAKGTSSIVEAQDLAITVTLADRKVRQAPHNALPPPETHYPPHHARPELGSERRRAAGSAGAPPSTTLLSRATDSVRTSNHHDGKRRREDSSGAFPSRRLSTG